MSLFEDELKTQAMHDNSKVNEQSNGFSVHHSIESNTITKILNNTRIQVALICYVH